MDPISEQSNKMLPQDGLAFINVRKLLLSMLRHWYFYPIVLIISGLGAYYFLKNKIPTFRVSTKILIEESQGNPGGDLLQGFEVRPGQQNMENQIIILSSYNMIRKVVNDLPFDIDVYRKGFRSEASYYPLSPLRISEGPEGLPYNAEFIFEHILDDKFHLTTHSNYGVQLDTILIFGQNVKYGDGSFTIYPQPELAEEYLRGDKIYFRFLNKDQLTGRYMSRLQVRKESGEGSIINISLVGANRIKDIMFLDKLSEVFLNDNLDKKNKEAKRVIDFIDNQLVDVSASLALTETELQEFRSRNRIMDVSAQSQQIIEQAVILENERARLNIEKNYYEDLEEYLDSDEYIKSAIAPASIGITHPLLSSLIQELAGLQAEYLSSGVGERNPLQGQLEMRIQNTKNSIKETSSSMRRANQMAIDENARQIDNLNIRAARLPEKERQLLGFERRFNLNNVLYTFLLQRRAEAQIQSASNTPDNELIDPARAKGPISPNRRIVIILVFALTLGIPTLILLLRDLLRSKIMTEEDLQSITQMPVMAHLPHSRISYNLVVFSEPSSRISEAFRSLRTRLDFYSQDTKCPIIVLTSSMPGEGKSFSAINLASAYSLTGKRTLLLGFDLRRPTVYKSFSLENEKGITSYLIGRHSLDEVIHISDYENLHIIPSGPIPPNPGELCASEKALELFSTLKEKYDCIIVDSPPVGIVSDIYPITAIADAVLLTVRHGRTEKRALSSTLTELQFHQIKHVSLSLNDIRTRGSGYSYSYKYKYEYKQKKIESNSD